MDSKQLLSVICEAVIRSRKEIEVKYWSGADWVLTHMEIVDWFLLVTELEKEIEKL